MTTFWRIEGIQRAGSAVAFSAYMAVLAMAACPALHHWLHDDADEADHQCAAVTVIQGQVDRPVAELAGIASAATFWLEPRPLLYAVMVVRLFLTVRGLEHAPPIG